MIFERPEFADGNVPDPQVAHFRKTYYDPDKLDQPDSTLPIVLSALTDLMADTGSYRHYSSSSTSSRLIYERTIVDDVLVTDVSIVNEQFRKGAPLLAGWQALVHTHDALTGDRLVSHAYSIAAYVGGIVSMDIQSSLDGTAAALSHDDPLFLRAVGWQPATEYDAEQLVDRLDLMKRIPAPGERHSPNL